MNDPDDVNALISRAKAGDDDAFSDLCVRYSKLIETAASRYALMGSEYGDLADDFRQEATFALFRAVKSFDLEQSEVTFGLYAKTCVRNALISQLRKLSAKARPGAVGRETSGGDVESQVISEEMLGEFMSRVEGVLTPIEGKVLAMSMCGLRPRKIAERIGSTPKAVSNALYRARSKLRKNPDIFI